MPDPATPTQTSAEMSPTAPAVASHATAQPLPSGAAPVRPESDELHEIARDTLAEMASGPEADRDAEDAEETAAEIPGDEKDRIPQDDQVMDLATDVLLGLAADFAIDPDLFGALPKPMQKQFSSTLTKLRDWHGEILKHAEGWAQRAGEIAAREQQLIRIAEHPRFQAAMAALGGNGTAAGNGANLDPSRWPEPETEMERVLQTNHRALEQRAAQLEQALRGVAARFQADDQRSQQVKFDAVRQSVAEAHKELDARFPDLAGNASQRQQWHALAAQLARGAAETDQPIDARTALELAARALGYETAETRGAQKAREELRKAGRNGTLRSDAGSPGHAAGARGDSLDEIARAIAREQYPELIAT